MDGRKSNPKTVNGHLLSLKMAAHKPEDMIELGMFCRKKKKRDPKSFYQPFTTG